MLHLTIKDLFSLTFGDEGFYHDRVWLALYTDAHGHCRIIPRTLAESVYAIDPDEQFSHIQVYEVAKLASAVKLTDRIPESFRAASVSPLIYTLWPINAWRESNERLRLLRDESNTRRVIRSTRDTCEFIARDVAVTINGGRHDEQAKLLMTGLMNQAAHYEWDVAKLIEYIDFLVVSSKLKDANGDPLDLTSRHKKDFLTTTDNANPR